MKERLTKRSIDGSVEYENGEYVIRLYQGNEHCYSEEQKAILKLAEYEDLEEQGLLVRLPCKVGDRAFGIVDTFAYNNTIRELKIMGLAYMVEDEYRDLTFQNVERIFKTEAEAEKKLKELKGEKQ